MMWRNFLLLSCLCGLVFGADYRLPRAQRYTVAVSSAVTMVGSYYPAPTTNTKLVVLLHMLGRNRGDWNECARFLQKEGYAVVSLDLPGHGESTNGWSVWWSRFTDSEFANVIPQTEAALKDIRQTYGSRKIAVVGMGYGATLALYFRSKGYSSATVLVEPVQLTRGVDVLDYTKGPETPLYIIVNNDDTLAQKIKSLVANCTVDVYSWSLNPLRWFMGNTMQYEHIARWLSLHLADS